MKQSPAPSRVPATKNYLREIQGLLLYFRKSDEVFLIAEYCGVNPHLDAVLTIKRFFPLYELKSISRPSISLILKS